jgi:transposase
VHLILENSSAHKTALIRRWLFRHPYVYLHFTPTGASWINPVKRWFAALTKGNCGAAFIATRETSNRLFTPASS